MSHKETIVKSIAELNELHWYFAENGEMRAAKRLDTIVGKLMALYEILYGKCDEQS